MEHRTLVYYFDAAQRPIIPHMRNEALREYADLLFEEYEQARFEIERRNNEREGNINKQE